MNKEEIYDNEIHPLMVQIIDICKQHGIEFIASFDIPTEDNPDLAVTTHMPDGDGNYSDILLSARIKLMQLNPFDGMQIWGA